MHSVGTQLFLILAGFFAGFVDSIAGGGGLISLPAFLSVGLPPATALGTNKLVGVATALASSTRYRAAGLVSWRKLGHFFALALVLSCLGAFLATRTDPGVLRPVLLVLLVAAGVFVLVRNRFGLDERRDVSRARWLLLLIPLIGFYDGFFGPGTGTFLMMGFVLLGGDALLGASAKSRWVNLASNLGAILCFASTGHMEIRLALPAAVASFLGGILGAQFSIRRGARLIRPVFIAVTWGLIAKVAYDFLR